MDRIWTKHYEDGVPKDMLFEEITIVDYFERSASTWASRPAITFKGKSLTYGEMKDHVDRFAAGLAGLGVQKGDRVALWMPNLPQMLIAYYAVLKIGGVVVMTNPLYVEREIEHQFNDSGATVVVTCDFLWWYKLRGVLGKIPSIRHVVVTGIPDYLPFPLNLLAPLKLRKTGLYVKVPKEEKVLFFREVIAANKRELPKVEVKPTDLAVLQYTGGTTGLSKGAMLTHKNISFNAQQCMAWFPRVEPGKEILLACLPYFHVFGMTVCMNWPIMAGIHIVLMPNPRDIPEIVSNITEYRVTLFPALPALFNAINNYPGIDKLDITSVKGCFSGSAPLPLDVLERFENLTGGKITEGFGLTECSPVTHGNPLNGLRKPGSVGIPFPETDMKIVDIETGSRELDPGQEGELCVTGPQVMAGYWRRAEETSTTLRGGWIYTGDIARVDKDGYTYIVGRKKDMIIAGGYNVYPDEIDGVLAAHPAVLEAATIGIPDQKRGETVKSFIVLKPGATATAEEILAHCTKELAAYKRPKIIQFVEALPKSSIMKILRRELRDMELKAMGKSAPKAASSSV